MGLREFSKNSNHVQKLHTIQIVENFNFDGLIVKFCRFE